MIFAVLCEFKLTDLPRYRNEKLLQDPVRLRQISERIPAGRWGDPKDFAGPVVFLSSRASQYVCGELLVVDGVSITPHSFVVYVPRSPLSSRLDYFTPERAALSMTFPLKGSDMQQPLCCALHVRSHPETGFGI